MTPIASKLESLDMLLVQRVARRPWTFKELQGPEIMAATEPLALPDRYGVMAPTWRVLDPAAGLGQKAGSNSSKAPGA